MERRFVIAEDYDVEGSAPTITESELKRRCEIVASILSGHSPGIREWNEARDILVNGEEKLEDQRCQKICKAHLDSVEQPDPWEEWIEKMPCFGDYDISDYNRYMKQWLRQMPRR